MKAWWTLTFLLSLAIFFLISSPNKSFSPSLKTNSTGAAFPTPTNDPSPTNQNQKDKLVRVTKIIDGDTIEIESGHKLRYIGIDTPELSDKNDCFAKESSLKNKDLVEGRLVSLEKDVSETDKYGRLLRYVYVGRVLINESLVREGFARSSTFPPDVKYQERFLEAEREAREQGRGLWKGCQNLKVLSTTDDCSIKGNVNSSGEKIYHLPGGKFYNKTRIDESGGERYFCSEEEAVKAGWRKSKI